ncbi:hypothetical protein [Eudoraea chungangensis]|uniref:hypothetical protein n=1 Tax=Eudoraea chungangensis TaxID=1481905 RepID=UPI0023EDA63E|nr:hypothetical protein [Eudoraea chungangensis]
MESKKSFIKKNSSKRIQRQKRLLIGLITVISLIVLYDSFIHKTPLYYIGFYFLGKFVGRIYRRFYTVKYEKEEEIFSLSSSSWNIIFTVLLVSMKLVLAKKMLHSLDVIWTTDAIYLFSIGIYFSKWKSIARQFDDLIYNRIAKIYSTN